MKTHYKKLRNPNYIGAYELMQGEEAIEIDVTITKVVEQDVQNGDKKEPAMVVYFQDQKPMIVNATNAKAISKATNSPYVEDWVGKSITLYVERVRAFGDMVDALRVKTNPPKPVSIDHILKLTDPAKIKSEANKVLTRLNAAQKGQIRQHIEKITKA